MEPHTGLEPESIAKIASYLSTQFRFIAVSFSPAAIFKDSFN